MNRSKAATVDIHDLRDQLDTVKNDIKELGGLVRKAARSRADDVRGNAAEAFERGRRRVGEMGEQVEHYLGDRPLQSVLIAAGIGALIGFLWPRR